MGYSWRCSLPKASSIFIWRSSNRPVSAVEAGAALFQSHLGFPERSFTPASMKSSYPPWQKRGKGGFSEQIPPTRGAGPTIEALTLAKPGEQDGRGRRWWLFDMVDEQCGGRCGIRRWFGAGNGRMAGALAPIETHTIPARQKHPSRAIQRSHRSLIGAPS